jgi:chromosome segregation ATPase
LNALQSILKKRLKEMEDEEAGIRNKAARERAEVAKIDGDIAKSRDEWAEADRNRREHDRKAEEFDAGCQRNWWTCSWNVPKAAWERSMAALDQTNMNRINSWISWLNFTKVFPGSVVAMNDISVAPINSVKKMLQEQIQGVENTKRELQNTITAKQQEMENKISDRKARDRAAADQIERDTAALNSQKSSQEAKAVDLDRRKKQLELEAAKAREEADKYENLARAAQPPTGAEIRSASVEMKSAIQSMNELFSQEADQKKDEQAEEMARMQEELEAKRRAVEEAAKEQEAKIQAMQRDMEMEEPQPSWEQEEETAPQHCDHGTWSPTFGRCIEEVEQEVGVPQDCQRGSWSPTLRMCVE